MAGFLLSEADRNLLREVIRRERNRPQNAVRRPAVQSDDQQGPEVYLALTPPDGIPAMTPGPGTGTVNDLNQPGFAECSVFVVRGDVNDPLNPPTIYEAGFSRLVLNASANVMPGDELVVIARDKFGSWWIIGTQGGGGTVVWVKILCAGASAISGYWPGVEMTFNTATRIFEWTGDTFEDVKSPSFSAGSGVEIDVEDASLISAGRILMILDGLCNSEGFTVTDVDASGTGTGTDVATGTGLSGSITGTFVGSYVKNGVKSFMIANTGTGYAGVIPNVVITDGMGNISAMATAVLDATGDFVKSITVTSPGADYDPATTTVTIDGPTGPGSTVTATAVAVLSGPIRLYFHPVWVWPFPTSYVPIQNDVDEPVIWMARVEKPYSDGIGVRVAEAGETLDVVCVGGPTFTWYGGRLVAHA